MKYIFNIFSYQLWHLSKCFIVALHSKYIIKSFILKPFSIRMLNKTDHANIKRVVNNKANANIVKCEVYLLLRSDIKSYTEAELQIQF